MKAKLIAFSLGIVLLTGFVLWRVAVRTNNYVLEERAKEKFKNEEAKIQADFESISGDIQGMLKKTKQSMDSLASDLSKIENLILQDLVENRGQYARTLAEKELRDFYTKNEENIDYILWVNKNGRLKLSVPFLEDLSYLNIPLKKEINKTTFFDFDVRIPRGENSKHFGYSVKVATPLNFEMMEDFQGDLLLSHVRLDEINKLLAAQQESESFIYDQAGFIIFHKNPEYVLIPVSGLPQYNLMFGPNREANGAVFNRDVVITPELGWNLKYYRNYSTDIGFGEIEAVKKEFNAKIYSFFGICVILALIVGWLISGRIAKPILILTEGAQRIRDGVLDTRINIKTRDETNTLAVTFNEMAIALQQRDREKAELIAQLDIERKNLKEEVIKQSRELVEAEREKRLLAEHEKQRALEINRLIGHDFPMMMQVPIDIGVLLTDFVLDRFSANTDTQLPQRSKGFYEEIRNINTFMSWAARQGNEMYGFITKEIIGESFLEKPHKLPLEEFNLLEIFHPSNGGLSEVQITFESLRYIYGRLKFGIDPEDEEKFKTFMQLKLNLALPPEPLKVKNSKFLMLSHVRNLLSNSIKHIRLQDLKDDSKGETINLKVESCLDNNFIKISVTDYGAGVQAEKLKELQRIFAQEAEGSRKDEPGEDSKKGRDLGSRIRRGRGLINMARELYRLKEYQAGGMKDQAKGGWVEVKNNESSRGATFTLFIPKLL